VPTPPDDPRLTGTWQALRGLRLGQFYAALAYRPAQSSPGRHYTFDTVPMRPGRRSTTLCMVDDEPAWWLLGHTDADNPRRSDEVLGVLAESPPATIEAAQAVLPGVDHLGNPRGARLSPVGIRYVIGQGGLAWLYGPDRRRRVFADQVAAEAARREALIAATALQRLQADAEAAQRAGRPYRRLAAQAMSAVGRTAAAADAAAEAAARWAAVERLLPPFPPRAGTPPPPKPVALTVSLHKSTDRRLHDALNAGHRSRWFNYLHPDDGDTYLVELAAVRGPSVIRRLPGHRVLPWLRGVADWHGAGVQVVYRDGLERERGR
jgi:hypothetical protein